MPWMRIGDERMDSHEFLSVGPQATCRLDTFDAVACLGDDTQVGLAAEDEGEPGPHHRVVVDEQQIVDVGHRVSIGSGRAGCSVAGPGGPLVPAGSTVN